MIFLFDLPCDQERPRGVGFFFITGLSKRPQLTHEDPTSLPLIQDSSGSRRIRFQLRKLDIARYPLDGSR